MQGEAGTKKRPMEMIVNEKMRRTSFDKRQRTLTKKAYELSTLCAVDVCMLSFGPDGTLHTWPEDRTKVRDIVTKYKSLGEREKSKKRLDLASFLKKLQLDEEKKTKDVERSFPTWDKRLDGYSSERLMELNGFLDSKLRSLHQRIRLLAVKKEEKAIQETGLNRENIGPCKEQELYQSSSLPLIDYKPDCSSFVSSTPLDQPGIAFTNLLGPTNFAPWPCQYYPGDSNKGYDGSVFYHNLLGHGIDGAWLSNCYHQFMGMGSQRCSNSSFASMENKTEAYGGFLMSQDCDNAIFGHTNNNAMLGFPQMMTPSVLHEIMPVSPWNPHQPLFQG